MPAADLVVEAPRAVVDGREPACTVLVDRGHVLGVEDRLGLAVDAEHRVRLDDDVVLLPGLVDTHVHCNDPGRTHWEGFEHATRAAAAGGVTTLVDMPLNSVPPTVDVAALAAKRAAAAGRCFVDVGFWGGAVPGNPARLRPLWDDGVLGFKCFLVDSGVEEFPPLGEVDLLRTARERAARRAAAGARRGPRQPAAAAGRRRLRRVRREPPREAEVAAVTALVELAKADGLPDPRRPPGGCGGPARPACGPRRRRPRHGRDLPALPHPDGVRRPRRRRGLQVLPAAARRRQPGGAVAGLRDATLELVVSDHSPCPAELKARRLRRSVGWHQLPPAGAGRHLDRGAAPRARAPRRGPLDGHRPRRSRGSGRQGQDRRGR